MTDISENLNQMHHAQRLTAMRTLRGSDQGLLYEMAEGNACHLAGDFVPSTTPPLTEIVHHGVNSLPILSFFQKRFAWRDASQDGREQIGYNVAPAWETLLIGPGYFTAKDHVWHDGSDRVVIDYFDIPSVKVPTWPEIKPNSQRLSRFVYFQMRDWMWKVSDHISIGRAKRVDSWLDAWFLLCREDQ